MPEKTAHVKIEEICTRSLALHLFRSDSEKSADETVEDRESAEEIKRLQNLRSIVTPYGNDYLCGLETIREIAELRR